MSFILIDRILALSAKQVVAEKEFKENEPIFKDHFPGHPIVPGTLLLEGMAQTCGWWIAWNGAWQKKSVLLMADRAQFRHFVRPGETIRFEGTLQQSAETRARFEMQATVEGLGVARAELSFAVFGLKDPLGPFHDPAMSLWIEETFQKLGGPAATGQLS